MYTAVQISIVVMLLKAFLDTIPKELDEQAWIDGCTRLGSYFRILIPALLPSIVAALVFVSTYAWNEFVFAFLFTGTRAKTAPIYINEMVQGIGEGAADWGTVFAAATIQLLPVLLWIWFLQRKMVGGFTIGAVKG
jgi:multiple sugar transport system permease protein